MMSGEVKLCDLSSSGPSRSSMHHEPCHSLCVCECVNLNKVLLSLVFMSSVFAAETRKGKLGFVPIYILSFAIRFIPRQSDAKQAQMYLLGRLKRLY